MAGCANLLLELDQHARTSPTGPAILLSRACIPPGSAITPSLRRDSGAARRDSPRTVLHVPRPSVFDEATSPDAETDGAAQQAVNTLTKSRRATSPHTQFWTLIPADQIVVLATVGARAGLARFSPTWRCVRRCGCPASAHPRLKQFPCFLPRHTGARASRLKPAAGSKACRRSRPRGTARHASPGPG